MNGFFIMGIVGVMGVLALREALLQHLAREKEKETWGIQEETAETTYCLSDAIKDVDRDVQTGKAFFKSLFCKEGRQ